MPLTRFQAFILAIELILTGLGTGSIFAQTNVGNNQEKKNDNMVLKTLVIKDSQDNQPAFSLLIPADWKGEGKVIWRWHTTLPATGTMTAWNPNGVEAIRSYANIPFVDGVRESAAQNAAVGGQQAMKFQASLFPEGSYYGMGNEVRVFAGKPVDYLTKILLPRQRPEIKGYRIITVQEMPKWAQSSSYMSNVLPGMQVSAQAGRVRIEYTENSRTIHEDFFLLLPRLQMDRLSFWGVESASSVRGEVGKLDSLHNLHNTMLFSMKLDLNWYNKEQQVAAILQDMVNRKQQQLAEINQICQRTRTEISKTVNDSYKRRQETQDRLQRSFSQIIRGVQTYTGSDSNSPVELPIGYNHAWTNNQGEYILSNYSNYNPNRSLNGNWKQLSPKP